MSRNSRPGSTLALSILLLGFAYGADAQSNPHALNRVTEAINESRLVSRPGNVHPAVFSVRTKDLGPLADSRQFQHLQLQLQRNPEDAEALQVYIDSLADPKSANFHKFGTAAEFSEKFGVAPADLDVVKNWLTSHGFTVNFILPNLVVDFSGSAQAIRETFHTQLDKLSVDGVPHFANVSNPQIPEALASVVLGPVALHDFKPRRTTHIRVKPQVYHPDYTVNADYQLVTPLDLQTIYNMTPVYKAGLSGQGQTVVLLERTNLYSTGDFLTFRKVLGLSRAYPKGHLITVHPKPMGTGTTENGVAIAPEACGDPGIIVGDDGEAATDVEWASASAPNATIELASCADTDTTYGFFIAMENLLTGTKPPPAIMSLSYSSPESEQGAAGNAYVNALYQLASFEGVSMFVSTGDADGDVTDALQAYAVHGISVNAFASTPNNVAVGGTDFGDAFLGETGTYWSENNGPNYNSALSYVPEIPWNDSCASQLIAISLGYSSTYGNAGLCNSELGEEYFLTTAGGSGGPSGCASGEETVPGVVSGTCKGYAKPAFQKLVFGNPSDGVRDVPDLSFFAADGVWGHYFVVCYSDVAGNGAPCTTPPSSWVGAGGTSFDAPIMAGVQALINQASAGAQGNPDFNLYLLASGEYGASGNAACNSTLGNAISSDCIFNDVTLGDNDTDCQKLGGKAYNCFYPGTNAGSNGVLSLSNTSYEPAFTTNAGYDLATGIGSVNVYNLVASWPGSSLSAKR